MQPVVEKLTGGEALSIDQLIAYLPALKEPKFGAASVRGSRSSLD
jgi:hypothetical protein